MKHRLRRALAAVAVLSSTLVAGTVTPASATSYTNYGESLNNAWIYASPESAEVPINTSFEFMCEPSRNSPVVG